MERMVGSFHVLLGHSSQNHQDESNGGSQQPIKLRAVKDKGSGG
jgi:hypothetical protein